MCASSVQGGAGQGRPSYSVREFAKQDAATSEALIETLANEAIRQPRPNDATFRQRVKFQTRTIRGRCGSATWAGNH